MTAAEPEKPGPQPAHPLGVPLMDLDHALLEEAIRRAEVAQDVDLPALAAAIVQELAAHFAREEELMRACDFPGLHCHVAQHRILVDEASRPLSAGAAALRRHLTIHVAQLVESHVLTLDTVTAAYIRGELSPGSFDNLRLPVEPATP